MSSIKSACSVVLRQTFQPLGRIHGTSQLISNALVYLSAFFALPAAALYLQSFIPGVRNLYPWVFPLIVFNSVLTVMVFIAAVRLQLPRDRALLRLAELRTEGVRRRNQGLRIAGRPGIVREQLPPEVQQEHRDAVKDWIESYRQWEDEVHDEINKLSSVQAELWTTLGDVRPVTEGHFATEEHRRYMGFFNEHLRRLAQTIDRFRQ